MNSNFFSDQLSKDIPSSDNNSWIDNVIQKHKQRK